MKRYGMIIRVKAGQLEEYRRLHAAVWPDVIATITACNIRNYSIFLRDNTLFSYFEYVGVDFAADMKRMADDPATQRWWDLTKPCQEPVPGAQQGEWWAPMEEVFHCV